MYREGCVTVDSYRGDLCFNLERNIVWMPVDEQEAELYSVYLDLRRLSG